MPGSEHLTSTFAAQTAGDRRRTGSLRSFLNPQSIAVVGASDVAGKVGHAVMLNLLAAYFPGKIYPVNSRRGRVMGQEAYPAISALPETPELAVIATPAATVPSVVEECTARQVPAVLIISAGFREIGPAGEKLEEEVRARLLGDTRVIGPNCLGVMSPAGHVNATFAASMAMQGQVAFLSQSGALCTAVLDWSLTEQVGFSALVSLGSMLDVDWADAIRHFGEDQTTKCIVMYMETIGDPRAFITAAREVALRKPIVVIKAGRTEAAARVAMSHTGSLAGSDAVLDAAFRRCGILRVKTIAELFYMADVLGKQPRPAGPKLAIVTNAGGLGVLATDALIDYEGTLAELSPATIDGLDRLLPAHWSHGNPVDVLGDASEERYARALGLALHDPGTDGLLAIVTPQGVTSPTDLARVVVQHNHSGKPIIASFMGGKGMREAEDILNSGGIPSFPYPDSAARVFEYMWQYNRNLHSLYETPSLDEEGLGAISPDVATIIREALESGRTVLSETESKQILQAYRIPAVESIVAEIEDEAVGAARRIGFPIVLKLHSRTITHKSDAGGVMLNISTEGAVREAFQSIRRSVAEKAGPQHFQGVSVQRMLPWKGYELILGSSEDPQFGPVILFGLGGELVEVFRDRALALPPLNTTLARRLVEQTKVHSALKGARGRGPVDLHLLERILVRFSRLVVEHPRIREIDINPLFVSEREICALDARIILHPSCVPDEQLPRSAIRPFPNQYSKDWVTRAGDRLRIRPIRPEDEPKMVTFHRKLSDHSVHMRYFAALSYQQRTAHERLTRVCAIDYNLEMALVAEVHDGARRGEIVGVGRLVRNLEANSGEFALVVADDFQRRGIGAELLQRLVQVARDEQLDTIEGWIVPSNSAMQILSRKLGFDVRFHPAEGLAHATLSLGLPSAPVKNGHVLSSI